MNSMNILVIFIFISVQLSTAQSPPPTPSPGMPPDICNCYCCPSRTNPYGTQKNCNTSSPDFAGSFRISDADACSLAACGVTFPIACPQPPLRNGGALRWGCKIGCRFGPDGHTLVNESAKAAGIDGLGDSEYSSALNINSSYLSILLVLIFI